VIHGKIDRTSGVPFLTGQVIIPRFGLIHEIDLLVDTGSDRSCLMPRDWGKIGVHFENLHEEGIALGAGGPVSYRVEDSILLFRDTSGRAFGFSVRMGFAAEKKEIRGLPSILGRDVLSRMRMLYDPARAFLGLKVLDADVQIPFAAQ
jgi:hypothetical protein